MPAPISLTREQYLDSIRQAVSAARDLAGRLNMNQMTWQPQNGEGWSIVECLDHLAISTGIYLEAMEPAIMEARSGASAAGVFRTAGWPSAKMVRDLEPPPRRRFPAPAKIRPRPTLKPEGILPRFLAAMDRVSGLVVSTGGKDLNAVRFRNPLIPVLRFTVASGFLIVAAHTRRHLWQAEQVAREPDFPVQEIH
jgi:hypothetical protein